MCCIREFILDYFVPSDPSPFSFSRSPLLSLDETTQRNDILSKVWSRRLITPGATVTLSTKRVHLRQLLEIKGLTATVQYEPQADRLSQRQGRHTQVLSLHLHYVDHQ